MKIKVEILKYFLITLGFILNFNYSYSQNDSELYKFYKNKDYAKAEKLINETLLNHFKDPNVYLVAGNIYFNIFRFDEAIEMYKKAVQIDTNFFHGKVNQAITLAITGRSKTALELLVDLQQHTETNLTPHIDITKNIFLKETLSEEVLNEHDSLYQNIVSLLLDDPSLVSEQDIEIEPMVDLVKLQRIIVYPEAARIQNIQGKVFVRLLIDTNGRVRKSFIEESDHYLLNNAALEAVRKYCCFEPAKKNGDPLMCWVSIPITFKLRN